MGAVGPSRSRAVCGESWRALDGGGFVRQTNTLAFSRAMEDQLTAHLDRGWDLAQKGDAPGATACAKRALEIDPQSPEVHNLMGFASALEGDAEEALEHYRQAIALDESYFEAMLNAAEVMIAPLADYDGAVAQIDEALDYAETNEEVADCILLKVDAFTAKGDYEEAKRAMKMLPEGPFDTPSYLFLIGRAWYELGQLDKAAPLIEQAAKADPASADAQYYLGLVRDEQGDTRGAIEALLRSRALDAVRVPPSWAPSSDAFAAIVKTAIEKLDRVLARYVREAEVYVVDLPGAELVVDGVDPRALLVLDAPPTDDGQAARVRVFVYQRNVERIAGSLEAVDNELTTALEREVTAVFLEGQKPDKAQLN
jgi:tetratricopeptide (TPR) repeat protein